MKVSKYFFSGSVKTLINHFPGVYLTKYSIREFATNSDKNQKEKNIDSFKTFNNKGVEFFNSGRMDQAITNYDQALDINPRSASVYYNKGRALEVLGKKEEAVACYDQVIKLMPSFLASLL